MSFLTRNKAFRSSPIIFAEWQRRSDADAVERLLVLEQLESALTEYSDDQVIDWYAHEVELQEGSSLYEIYNPGRLLFNQMLEHGAIKTGVFRAGAYNHNGLIRITSNGAFEARAVDGWVDLIYISSLYVYEELHSALDMIADIARATGGYVWPDLNITLDQWFTFHEINLPKNKADVRNLLALFNFDPQVNEPENYWEYFQTDDQTLVALSEEQFSAIRKATSKLIPGVKLLTALYGASRHAVVSHANAAQIITELVSQPDSQIIARQYVQELGWYGKTTGQTVSVNILRQLLMTAVLLDLDPSIGQNRPRKKVLGLDLNSSINVGRHPSSVLEDVTTYLQNKHGIDSDLAPLAAHLLLARTAPEFLVREVPSSITIGSIAWISFCRGVLLVEAVKAGSSRVLNYAQIMAYAELDPVSEAQKHLKDLAMIDPIIDWALLNQIVTSSELAQSEEASTRRALDEFEKHAETFAHIARTFSTPLPSRANIARKALKVAAPGCDTLDEKALSEKGGQQVMSMVDLHQSGDLVTAKWDRRTVRLVTNGVPRPPINYNQSGVSLYTRYPKLLQLKSCDEELDRQLELHLDDLNNAMLSTVKLAIAQMAEADLKVFLNSKVHFFTVRESAVYTSTYRAGGPFTYDAPRETQQSRDAATGRFGVVMCAMRENTLLCYELFTSRGEIRKNDALGDFITREGKLQESTRLRFHGNVKDQQKVTATQSLPLDVKRYTHATAENTSITSSMAILDKLGTQPKPRQSYAPKHGFYQTFNDPNVEDLAGFVFRHRPFFNAQELRELVRIPTDLELSILEGDRLLTYFIDLVVPFKRCIEDIASGEHDKVVDGVYGCLMDGIGLVGTVVGASTKALSISAKAISRTSKAAQFTKLAFTSAISLFNPLDGVPSGLQAGGKLVHKGLLRFNKNTHEIIAKANTQLHRLSGRRQSYALTDVTNNAHMGLGNWKPRAAAGEATAVLAARDNNKWYALNRRGNLWGKPLDGFAFQAPLQLPYSPKTLPVGYTRNFIEKSLPRARAKIDNAIDTLIKHDFKRDRDLVMKTLFGDTSAIATDRLVKYLRLVRFDFAGFSLSNIVLDVLKDTDVLASFDVDSYKRWKKASSSDASGIAFVEIYTKNLNKHFVSLGFNHDVVADDLIHELFHASAQTADVGYASDAELKSDNGQRLDVASLLNLAAGRLPVTEASMARHESSKAFENADSLAVATSLLSQLSTDKVTYDQNMTIINAALAASNGKAIVEPVLITLNKPL
ncbi:hypothetical protein ACIOWE_06215 [Pseudomonas sp. NPDC087598]|uniref:hypothetical protein n=1 Tax=Pseudomonas sp. NPDC087598 TaxID=3364440 RepID=UPI00382419F3